VFVPVFLAVLVSLQIPADECLAAGVAARGLRYSPEDSGGSTPALAHADRHDNLRLHILYTDKYLKEGADPLALCCQQFSSWGC